MSFEFDLKRFAAKANPRLEEVKRKVSLDLFSDVVMDTPVDTGRARANWQLSIGGPAEGERDRTDPGGSATIAAAAAKAEGPSGDAAIFITNNVPYIRRLEYGHSKQSPGGMVRKNVARFKRYLEGAV